MENTKKTWVSLHMPSKFFDDLAVIKKHIASLVVGTGKISNTSALLFAIDNVAKQYKKEN